MSDLSFELYSESSNAGAKNQALDFSTSLTQRHVRLLTKDWADETFSDAMMAVEGDTLVGLVWFHDYRHREPEEDLLWFHDPIYCSEDQEAWEREIGAPLLLSLSQWALDKGYKGMISTGLPPASVQAVSLAGDQDANGKYAVDAENNTAKIEFTGHAA